MQKIITRFAPSPTGLLHVGNLRTAIINWLYAKKHGGQFILRIDDTDLIRSKDAFEKDIIANLKLLQLNWDLKINQQNNISEYNIAKDLLIQKGVLYPCYETKIELDRKRNDQLASGSPPIYDRAAMALSSAQKQAYKDQGIKPHYRFLIDHADIVWDDMIKNQIKYHGSNISDPILIRSDGSVTYLLSSVIDDINYNISHIIRGEDHISNSATQIQIFHALGKTPPIFGHLSLLKDSEDSKISKTAGGFDISDLINQGIDPNAINSFLALIGSSMELAPHQNIDSLINQFDIDRYSTNPTTYTAKELYRLNQKLVMSYDFSKVKDYFHQIGLRDISESFWLAIRPNIEKLSDVKEWYEICHGNLTIATIDQELSQLAEIASQNLPQIINEDNIKAWIKNISKIADKKGKPLYMALRLILTGKNHGPELLKLLLLIPRQEILKRLSAHSS